MKYTAHCTLWNVWNIARWEMYEILHVWNIARMKYEIWNMKYEIWNMKYEILHVWNIARCEMYEIWKCLKIPNGSQNL
jgi:hypothetical protein